MSPKVLIAFVMSVVTLGASSAAKAESEFTVFGGMQSAPHSRVTISGGGPDYSFLSAWEGRSFGSPPYYGLRYTQWRDANWGWAINFVHTKVYSSDQTRATNHFEVMELTDGINPLTANILYRFSQKYAGFQPYIGVGAGISIPHVELQKTGSTDKTFGYQYGGPVATVFGGLKYAITDRWSVMTEYQFHYYWIKADMEPASTFETNLITNAINVGVNYTW